MDRTEYERYRNSYEHYHSRHRKSKYDEEPENIHNGLFSNGQTVLILTVVVGCFGVLWPKIFSPMFFGDHHRHQDVADDAPGFHGASIFPEHQNPSMRGMRGGMAGVPGKQIPREPPIRTIDKEWPDKHPRPGMRPTLGGPGIQANQKQAAGGGMGVVMPIYTVAILVFFIYTIVKIIFKNKKNEEEDEDDEFLNSDYYKQYIAQQQKQKDEAKVKSQLDQEEKQQETNKEEIIKKETNKEKSFKNSEKKNVSFDLKEHNAEEESSSSKQSCEENDCKTDEDKMKMNDGNIEEVNSSKCSKSPKEMQTDKEEDKTSVSKTSDVDPRDIEIRLLKARLEQTEKTLQTVLAQMSQMNAPHVRKRSKRKENILEE